MALQNWIQKLDLAIEHTCRNPEVKKVGFMLTMFGKQCLSKIIYQELLKILKHANKEQKDWEIVHS